MVLGLETALMQHFHTVDKDLYRPPSFTKKQVEPAAGKLGRDREERLQLQLRILILPGIELCRQRRALPGPHSVPVAPAFGEKGNPPRC